jgi:hypothetical protein
MKGRMFGWLLVSAAVIIQFLLEVTLGRLIVAPAVLVPVLVYLSLSDSDFWAVEGALWSGLALDLLLHQLPGVSSLSILCGIALSDLVLKITTGALRMTFFVNAFISSIIADFLFILLASKPVGSEFSQATLLIFPRILFPLVLFVSVPLLFRRRKREFI